MQLNIKVLVANPGSNIVKRRIELNVREDLLQSEDIKIADNVDECPNIYVKIQRVETKALIDTGREITCISENFIENNKNKFKNCEILPLLARAQLAPRA